MRKELADTYQYQPDGSVRIRARSIGREVVERLVEGRDLTLDINYTDKQGAPKTGRVILRPMVSDVLRVDKILEGQRLFYLAALNCYSGLPTPDLVQKAQSEDGPTIGDFLKNNILATGHWSVLEHRGPSFLIDGISRACSHQLVRHRLFTYSQQSQRYQGRNLKDKPTIFPFIIPPRLRVDKGLLRDFLAGVKSAISGYYSLRNGGAFPEDARFLLPNAAATRIVMSGNPRAWLELIPKRTCARAQWEIDVVITEIARQLWQDIPETYGQVGPPCSLGACDQGKRSCGVPLGKPLSKFFEEFGPGDAYPHDRLIFGMR